MSMPDACPSCGRTIPEEALACASCGWDFVATLKPADKFVVDLLLRNEQKLRQSEAGRNLLYYGGRNPLFVRIAAGLVVFFGFWFLYMLWPTAPPPRRVVAVEAVSDEYSRRSATFVTTPKVLVKPQSTATGPPAPSPAP